MFVYACVYASSSLFLFIFSFMHALVHYLRIYLWKEKDGWSGLEWRGGLVPSNVCDLRRY